jgi:hypothetical protein
MGHTVLTLTACLSFSPTLACGSGEERGRDPPDPGEHPDDPAAARIELECMAAAGPTEG